MAGKTRFPIGTALWAGFFTLLVVIFLALSHYWEALFLESLKSVGLAWMLTRYRSGLDRLGNPEKSLDMFSTVSAMMLEMNILSDVVVAAVLHHNHQIGLSYWSR